MGKTEVSIALAERTGGEIISADAFQVYRGMDIGTAKPTPDQQRRVPHHLIDILNLDESYSVARFRQSALELIPEVVKREHLPLVVGGSALYIKCLVDGIFDSPPADQTLRSRLRREEEKEPGTLHRRLTEVDPPAARKIHANNRKRIIRALEVFELTGVPISQWQKQWPEGKKATPDCPLPTAYTMIGLRRDRKDLYSRIEKRVEEMFENGLVEETEKLLEAGIRENRIAWQALGYKEVEGFLRGEYPREEAQSLLSKKTRNFAKRQLTWWRADKRIHWVDICHGDTAGKIVETIFGLINPDYFCLPTGRHNPG